MLRRISTKWVLAVLAVVVLPFLGFAWYVDDFVSERFSEDVVRYHLLSHAAELADRLDTLTEERMRDAEEYASVPSVSYCLADQNGDRDVFDDEVVELFDELVFPIRSAEFVLAIGADGEVAATNSVGSQRRPLDPWTLDVLGTRDWRAEPWFAEAMSRGEARIDVFESGLVRADEDVPVEARYHFGFAHVVFGKRDAAEDEVAVGLVAVLVPWSVVQQELQNYGVRRRRDRTIELASDNIYDSTYAWVWASDAETILAHEDRDLYGARVSEPPVDLPALVAAARASRVGMYPDYEFRGERKRAAFKHTRSVDENGFGWIVGVGVDFPDIFGPIHEITGTIAQASGVVLLIAVLVTIVVARRTTRPVQELEAFTRRVATGDLDAQVPVHGNDELGDLARSFNRMTMQLKENRQQLVRAEKDAAWREMARQVAHEIKNPLTPIELSVSLVQRAYNDKSPEFDSILTRTIEVVRRQVANMRDIARDFYRFAGEHREPARVDAREVVEEQLALHAAWAADEGVALSLAPAREGAPAPIVLADADEIRRAVLNLVSNAIEATVGEGTGRGGGEAPSVEAAVDATAERVRITVRDTGPGIAEDVAERLFEPYFTTRSSGTGLGLAIVRRVVEDLGGSVSLENVVTGGRGAVATIDLPRAADAEADGAPGALP